MTYNVFCGTLNLAHSLTGSSADTESWLASHVCVFVLQSVKEPSPLIVQPLRDYQLIGINWLLAMYDLRAGCILADELALGKKVQVIGYMAQLASSQHVWGPHLIVTPTGCLPSWRAEFERWFSSSKTCVYYGVPFSKHGHLHGRRQVSYWSADLLFWNVLEKLMFALYLSNHCRCH